MSDTDASTTPPKADTDHTAEIDKWKALARKHEEQAKANKAELDRLMAAGDSSKSDTEKMAAELATLRAEVQEERARALKAEVAQEKGLTKAQARWLQGTSEEELNANADEILAAFKPADDSGTGDAGPTSTTRPTAGRPRESLRPSSLPGGEPQTDPYDSAKLLAAVPRV